VHVVTDDHAAQFLEDEDEAVGHQHLLQVLALVQVAVEDPLEHVAQQHGQHHAHGQHRKETAAEGGHHRRRQGKRHVGADHVEAAVRQVDDAHDSEDERQAAGHQEQQQPVLHRIQALDEEGDKVHAVACGPGISACCSRGPGRAAP
jgi:hypothetical protein